MPRRFTQSDITRAVTAFGSTGLQLAAVKIELDGTIVLIAAAEGATEEAEPDWRHDSPLYAPREEKGPRYLSMC